MRGMVLGLKAAPVTPGFETAEDRSTYDRTRRRLRIPFVVCVVIYVIYSVRPSYAAPSAAASREAILAAVGSRSVSDAECDGASEAVRVGYEALIRSHYCDLEDGSCRGSAAEGTSSWEGPPQRTWESTEALSLHRVRVVSDLPQLGEETSKQAALATAAVGAAVVEGIFAATDAVRDSALATARRALEGDEVTLCCDAPPGGAGAGDAGELATPTGCARIPLQAATGGGSFVRRLARRFYEAATAPERAYYASRRDAVTATAVDAQYKVEPLAAKLIGDGVLVERTLEVAWGPVGTGADVAPPVSHAAPRGLFTIVVPLDDATARLKLSLIHI